ncbi:hypothetical protein WN72_36050 [Bradyrhizobium arachidis]|uniref:Uncharacterized protein n=1 Tax=Bradyrhizobium arachidis TaxID=858423 RepID=A0AAE7NVQ0_9BRAD|nr:hypothetical protein WN72_36050 [Bradyrhizobium arachidis]
MTCARCNGTHWVCENHPERPWEGSKACGCGGAGAPCPVCNRVGPDEMPLLPTDLKPALRPPTSCAHSFASQQNNSRSELPRPLSDDA